MPSTAATAATPAVTTYIPTAREQQLIDLRAEGLSAAQIAAKLSIAKNSVFVTFYRLRQKGVTVGTSTAPVGKRGKTRQVDVPAWVPEDLWAEYRRIAIDRGEEKAAAWARDAKRAAQADLQPGGEGGP